MDDTICSAREDAIGHVPWNKLSCREVDKDCSTEQGHIEARHLKKLLNLPEFQSEVSPHKQEVLRALERDKHAGAPISYTRFLNVMSNKRRNSFTLAVHSQDKPDSQKYEFDSFKKTGIFDKMVNKIAIEILPDKDERQYYTDRYTCLPPPIFLPCISAIEIGCYIYYVMQADGNISTNGPIPESNPFVYRPDKRIEIWRYVFYMLVHAGWVHLFFNMLVQLMLGVPLEMVHGSTRIAIIYFAGVIAGSLGTSVFDKDAYLLGASGGVYALLTAHLANILLNYQEMELRFLKLGALSIIASADIGFAIYERYSYNILEGSPPVAYVAHLTGAIAGLTLGLVILKNFEQKLYKQVLWWIALTIYGTCSLFAILWNIYHNT